MVPQNVEQLTEQRKNETMLFVTGNIIVNQMD